MSSQPEFSFLIANHNNRAYIGELIDSLQTQTFPGWEAVIVDDASDDGGVEDIVEARRDARLKYARHAENGGAGKAWNTAFALAEAPFLILIGADDTVAAAYLEKTRSVFQENSGINVVYADLRLFGAQQELRQLPERDAAELARRQWIPDGGACLRRSVWESVGGRYEGPELRHGNVDWDFWLGVAEKGLLKARRIPEPLYFYRQHVRNMTRTRSYYEYVTRECMYRRHRAFIDAQGCGRTFLADGYAESAAASWLRKEWDRAFECAARGAALVPPKMPELWRATGSVGELSRRIVDGERVLERAGKAGLAPTQEHIDARLALFACYAALEQWDDAQRHLCLILAQAVGEGAYPLAARLGVQLALLSGLAGRDHEAEEAEELARICGPWEPDAWCLRIRRAVAAGRSNKALFLLKPLLDCREQAALQPLMPLLALPARMAGHTAAQAAARFGEMAATAAPGGSRQTGDVRERLYRLALGRRLNWNFRARDLYETYGDSGGGFRALQQAVTLARARKVLEVGCGNGRNLVLFSRLGLMSVGQDISAAAIRLAKERRLPDTELVLAPLPELAYPDHYFDLVVCNRVLQHMVPDELPAVLDAVARLGKMVYINESMNGDNAAESYYLKKYDYTALLAERGLHPLAEISDAEVARALVFGAAESAPGAPAPSGEGEQA